MESRSIKKISITSSLVLIGNSKEIVNFISCNAENAAYAIAHFKNSKSGTYSYYHSTTKSIKHSQIEIFLSFQTILNDNFEKISDAALHSAIKSDYYIYLDPTPEQRKKYQDKAVEAKYHPKEI